MSITQDEYRRARFISEPAAQAILDAIRPSNRGRKTLDPVIFLTGMQLSIDKYNVATVTKIFHVLTHDLTRDDQWDLGVRTFNKNGKEDVITKHDLYALTKRITKMLDFTRHRAALLSDEERMLRRDQVDGIVAAILEPTLIPRPTGSDSYALDGTAIWASERSKTKIPSGPAPDPVHEEDQLNVKIDQLDQTQLQNPESNDGAHSPKPGKGHHGESDADFGAKTDHDGTRKYYFGYDVEALVRVPALLPDGKKSRAEPNLLEALVVIPGGRDIVNPCLRMFDRMMAEGKTIRTILVDRHYSYKGFDRWMNELMKRGIEQVADMHSNDQGFRDWDGMKFAAGWAHCPSTPDRLGTIPTLGPTATPNEIAVFNALINERRTYAAKRVNTLDQDGKIRFGCPALDGSVGCPLRAGTMATAIAAQLPVISNPPAEIGRPSICTQQTVQIQVSTDPQKRAMKMYQRSYWGSKVWQSTYARRTYVEGWFGVLKNTTATGFHRGSHQFMGLPLVSLALAMAAATTNLRLLRTWHAETSLGDSSHPLLQPDKPHYGFAEITEEESANLLFKQLATRIAA
jgi:hypothetical protein